MKRFILLSALFLLSTAFGFSQSFKAYQKAAAKALENKDYQAAMHYYQQALDIKTEHMDMWYRYADMAFRYHAFHEAKKAYLKVYESAAAQTYFPDLPLSIAEVNKQLGLYDEAIGYLTAIINEYDTEKERAPYRKMIKGLDNVKKFSQEQGPWKVSRLGRKVNTAYSEFAPYEVGDTLFFSAFRYPMEGDDYEPQRKISKVMFKKGQGRGRPISRGFNSDTEHTAHVALSMDKGRMYFTRCQYVNASEIRCQLFYRNKGRRNRWEKKAQRLPAPINTPGFTTTQPAVGWDSLHNCEVLIYVTDQAGGAGGLDIWRVNIYGDSLGTPFPLDNINTTADDITPFIHTASQALYFSSNESYHSMGGFDIYRCPLNVSAAEESVVATPLPPPLNSSYNDIYYFLNEHATQGYLSSNRPGALFIDEDKQACCNDIFSFSYIPPPPPPGEELDIPPVDDAPELPPVTPPVGINEPPTQLKDFLPLALYFDNDEPDKRTRKKSTQKTYLETYTAYIDQIATYEEAFAGELEGEQQEAALDAIADFFENDVEKGAAWLNRFSEILLEKLEQGDTVQIFVKGYTSPRAKKEYNLALSQRRISSVRNYFDVYQEGALQAYLASGQFRITERPFGEAEASTKVSDVLEDFRNSIYHPDAARERRVEIVEIISR
jgi:tetratricopeptide (TPR) repeat protein